MRMNVNPYQPSKCDAPSRRSRSTGWLLWTGVACCVLALICVAIAVGGMVWSFQAIAESPTAPRPQDLARDIGTAVIPFYAAFPLGLLGIILVTVGLVTRQPRDDQGSGQSTRPQDPRAGG
jgi:nitrate reductase NapE component